MGKEYDERKNGSGPNKTDVKVTNEQQSSGLVTIRPTSSDTADVLMQQFLHHHQQDCEAQVMPLPSPSHSQRRRGSTDSIPGAFLSDGAPGEEMRARSKISFSLLGSSTTGTGAPDLSLLSLNVPSTNGDDPDTHLRLESQEDVTDSSIKASQEDNIGGSTTNSDVEDGGLVVASMIREGSSQQITFLPEAEEVDLSKTEKKQRLTKKQSAGLSFVGATLLVVVVTGFIIFASTRNKDGATTTSSQPASSNNNNNSTGEEVSQVVPDNIHSMTESRVKELLPQYTLDTLMSNPDSPQARAYRWVLEDPHLQSYTNDRIVQRYALSTLFYSTNGQNWTSNTNWLSYAHHECQWFATDMKTVSDSGVLGNQAKKAASPYLDETPPCGGGGDEEEQQQQSYTHLWLFQNGLDGQLPPEMYLLTSLQTIFFGMDQLVGSTISSLIGNLSTLNAFFMVATGVGGTIPTQMAGLDKLETLYLFKNDISGTIPTFLPGSLEYLDLGENSQLSGTLPTQFGRLTSLRNLMLWIGQLSGTIPSEMGNMRALTSLNIGWNKLEGEIPTELGSNTLLRKIFLDKNALTGSLPSELAVIDSLEELWLHGNDLSGSIPSELADKNGSPLVALNLEGNPITGTIPVDLCHIGQGIDTCSLAAVFGCDLGFDCSDDLCGCDCSCSGSA